MAEADKHMPLPDESKLFSDLLERGRSFFSLAQLRQALRAGKRAKGPLSDEDTISVQ